MLKFNKFKYLGLFIAVLVWSSMEAQVERGFENYIYTPQFGNFDNLGEKGGLSIMVASGGLINSLFPSVRVSYSPLGNIGLGLNYFTFSSSNSNFQVQTTKAYIASGDIFYYGDLPSIGNELEIEYRVGLGYGIGELQRIYQNFAAGEANLGIQRYILESGVLLRLKKVGFGFGFRPKYYNFSNEFGFGDIDRIEVEKLDYIVNTAPLFLFDVNTRFEFGGEIGKLFFSWDQTVNKIKGEDEIVPGYLNKSSVHLGFYIMLNRAINNKKNKEK